MAAQTFKEQVAGLTKNTPTNDDLLKSFFDNGVKDIINRIRTINSSKLTKFASQDVTYVSSATRLDCKDIFEVLDVARGSYPSMEIPSSSRGELVTGSLFIPTAHYPKHYFLDGSLIIVPEPTSTAKGTISKISLPTISVSEVAITNFPSEFLHLLVFYAAMQTLLNRGINVSLPDDLVLPVLPSVITLDTISSSLPTFTAPSEVVLPTTPVDVDISFTTVDNDKPSWIDPSGIVLPVLDLSSISLTIAALTTPTAPTTPSAPIIGKGGITLPTSSIPTYIKPTLSLEAKPTITDLSIAAVAPTTPNAPAISADDASAAEISATTIDPLDTVPTYTKPTLVLEVKPEISDLDISPTIPTVLDAPTIAYVNAIASQLDTVTIDALETAPTYSKPTLTLEAKPTINDLSVSVVEPTTPTAPSFSYVDVQSAVIINEGIENLGSSPAFIKPIISLESKPTITDLSISESAPSAPSAPSFTYTGANAASVSSTTIGALGTAPTFIQPVSEVSMSDFDTAYDADDIELAATNIQKQAQLLQKHQIDIQNNLNKFNEEVVEYQADMQHKIEQAKIQLVKTQLDAQLTTDVAKQNAIQDFQVYVQEYITSIQKYSGEIQSYQASIGKEVQEWQANSNKDLTNWQNYNAVLLQQYTQDIQNEAQSFNSANVEFQADLQRKIENARIAFQSIQANAQLETDINKQNELQTLQAEIQEYVNVLQRHSLEVQKYQITVSKETQEWQANTQKDLSNWQAYNTSLIQQYSSDIQNELNEFNKEVIAYQTDFNHILEQAKIKLQENTVELQIETDVTKQNALQVMQATIQDYVLTLQNYSNAIQAYQAETNAEVSEWQANTQKDLGNWQSYNSLLIQQYSNDIQNELNEFNKENVAYQLDAQHIIEQARITMQEATAQAQLTTDVAVKNKAQTLTALIQDYVLELQKFTSDVQLYQQNINKEVQEWQVNNTLDLNNWQQYNSALLQQFGQDIQNELGSFNSSNVQYQAEIQKAIQEANNSMSSDVQEFAATLQKYSADIQKWQIEVNSEVTEWQQDIVQTAVLEYTTQRANNLQKYQIDSTSELGKYTNNLNKESQEYQSNLSKWGQLITRELQKYQAETGYDVSKYTSEVQAVVQKHTQDLQSAVQDFTEEVQKYSLETQSASAANNSSLTNYQAKISAYNAELGVNVQNFNTSLQKTQLDYSWITNQINFLTAEYDKGFVPYQQQQLNEGKE